MLNDKIGNTNNFNIVNICLPIFPASSFQFSAIILKVAKKSQKMTLKCTKKVQIGTKKLSFLFHLKRVFWYKSCVQTQKIKFKKHTI